MDKLGTIHEIGLNYEKEKHTIKEENANKDKIKQKKLLYNEIIWINNN